MKKSMHDVYLKLETLKTIVKTLEKKKENGVSVIIHVNNEKNQYGNNITGWVKQSEEDKKNKKPKFYVLNGKTFWTEDGELPADYSEQMPDDSPDGEGNNDLPF
jgi:hypothetical protein